MANGESTIHHMTPELVYMGPGSVHHDKCSKCGQIWTHNEDNKTPCNRPCRSCGGMLERAKV